MGFEHITGQIGPKWTFSDEICVHFVSLSPVTWSVVDWSFFLLQTLMNVKPTNTPATSTNVKTHLGHSIVNVTSATATLTVNVKVSSLHITDVNDVK